MIEWLPLAEIGAMPDPGLYELTQKILYCVGFMAIGGAVAVMFSLIFAQTIMGSKYIQAQLRELVDQTTKINEQLTRIADALTKNESRKSE